MALSKFLDPKNDISFKRIFGTEKNKDILIHFLNDILGSTGKSTIQDIEFLGTIQDPDIASKKQSIVDVLFSSIVEKWAYFFRYADETSEEELERIIGSDLIIKRAYEELNRFNWSEKEFIAYKQEIKRIRDEQAVLAQKLDDATQKGRLEGIQIGHEKGKIEGKIEVARNSLKAGVSIDVIAQITGLSHSEILQLKEKT
ncbi:Rpn family recombination-promoting nuclease/putative transposase [Wolbachia endosymbiont of Ctenocephalides felis wCfeJ]|uniref:Rpn family recombination-promoting nuclease/putative transposase n=1 Tax=Wolbachia endosymbiont of Ctenocephalides felis wCfeJ TaxID=2732594 RepID=UPI001444B1C7|nr:Rpn family recombination-promoting nuclease/putative transposase [Wolbachia endosymbiont of Ctenocephalides felis wCfeJ]WCR58425.1 MAG: hypothetical protein PG980_000897 [Wolbachia endosymbiont of Ctenocephalides felis wCfeJ]